MFVKHTATVSLPRTPRQFVALMNGPEDERLDQITRWYREGVLTLDEAKALCAGRDISIQDQEDVSPVLVSVPITLINL